MKRTTFNILRLIIWLLPILIVGWILMKNLVPSGQARIIFHQKAISDVVKGFNKPDDFGPLFRENGLSWRSALSEQANFTISPWRPFREIELTLSLLRPSTSVSLDAVARPNIELDPKTLFLPEFEGFRDWSAIQTGDTLLLQRQQHYTALEAFQADLPPAKEISTYKNDLSTVKLVNEELDQQIKTVVQESLRGSHRMRLYITTANPTIRLTIEKYDLNERIGPDRLTAFVYGPDKSVLFARTIEDDGNETEDRVRGSSQPLEIALTDLTPGDYQVALLANDEVVIDSIETTNRFMYLEAPFHPWADADHPSTIRAQGQVIEATNRSDNEESLWINDQEYRISAQSDFRYLSATYENSLKILSPMMHLTTSNGFSLGNLTNYVEPYGYPLLTREEADRLGINYLLAKYVLPERIENDVYRVTATYQTADLLLNGTQYAFSLESQAAANANFAIGDVNVRFHDDKLTVTGALRLLKSWAGTAVRSLW